MIGGKSSAVKRQVSPVAAGLAKRSTRGPQPVACTRGEDADAMNGVHTVGYRTNLS